MLSPFLTGGVIVEVFKDRKLEVGQKVRVYVNLHKQGMFSIVDMKTGLVCCYAKTCLIKDATFYVSESGREKVRKTKQKLVHAWVRGIFQEADLELHEYDTECQYNPYYHDGFTNNDGYIITEAPFAYMSNKKVYVRSESNDKNTR